MAKLRQGDRARSAATQAAPSRLPSTRERRPALAALAVILIVGGAAASGWLALRAGDRVEYLQVSQEVAQGQEIDEEDLRQVRLPRGFDDGVPAVQQEDVVGRFASTRLLPGTVLNPGMLSEGGGVAEGTAQVPVPVPQAVADDLTSGAMVALSVEGAQSEESETVIGEVVRAPEGPGDGGLAGGGETDVSVVVSIGSACFASVAAGLRDDSVQVARVSSAESAGIPSACRA